MNLPDPRLFHLATRNAWQQAVAHGTYAPESLQTEGFIHCSTVAQIVETANRWYRGRSDLLLLQIDARRLTADLRHEPPVHPGDERRAQCFPHIYGPLNLDAVDRMMEFPCDREGTFTLPQALRTGGQ
ncbi:MAG: DUF952 domain-containing protein [Acidobacteriia bacterium]|nr:DUF952 domain-containing protein [Terriglobia bacterium]